jgi:hypothetical protein
MFAVAFTARQTSAAGGSGDIREPWAYAPGQNREAPKQVSPY